MGSRSMWGIPEFPDVEQIGAGDLSKLAPDLIVVGAYGKEGSDLDLPDDFKEPLLEIIQGVDLAEKPGSSNQMTVKSAEHGKNVTFAAFILGPEKSCDSSSFLKLGTFAAKTASTKKSVNEVCLILPPTTSNLHATAALEGIFLGAYKDNRWRTEKKAPSRCAESVYLSSQVKLDIASIRCVCEGIIFTRQLVNAPPNVLKPAVLAQCMTECADRYGMDIKILEREDCEGLGMGLYLGVAQGATSDPKFIHVKYNPPNKPVKSVALVGKGICFDSGGYNLKTGPDSMINLMKFDMGGAATIFGAARAIAHLKIPDVEVHFITASCENMVSGHAYRPGDVLTASNGKTVEVVNTDAEGRMTLGDALVYADKLGVDYIVDVATLTGSVIVGLGNEYAGLFTPHDEIASLLAKAASDTGESLWRMPFVRAYRKLLDSSIADVKQCHTRPGDCINAAVMLNEFVSEETQWAHCDIAGTSWNFAENCATGYGVRTLVSFIKGLDRSQKQ